MKQYRYFSYTIIFIGLGTCIFLVAIYLGFMSRFLVSVIYFGKCVFPTSLTAPLIDFETFNNEEPMKIFTILKYINTLSSLFGCLGVIVFCFPIIVITVGIWIRFAYKRIGRETPIQFRYTNVSSFDDIATSIELPFPS